MENNTSDTGCPRVPGCLGAPESCRVMRFETNPLRVRYGAPIFVTFSPDEGHNLLMVRLSRTRRQDPVHAAADNEVQSRLAGDREWPRVAPDVDEARLDLPMDAGQESKVATHFAKRDVDDPERVCDKCKRAENREQKRRQGEAERKKCSTCRAEKPRDFYSGSLWEERPRPRVCIECVARAADERGEKHRGARKYTRKEMKSCTACGAEKPQAAFSGKMWSKVASKHRKCDECVKGANNQLGYWKCVQCKDSFETARLDDTVRSRAEHVHVHFDEAMEGFTQVLESMVDLLQSFDIQREVSNLPAAMVPLMVPLVILLVELAVANAYMGILIASMPEDSHAMNVIGACTVGEDPSELDSSKNDKSSTGRVGGRMDTPRAANAMAQADEEWYGSSTPPRALLSASINQAYMIHSDSSDERKRVAAIAERDLELAQVEACAADEKRVQDLEDNVAEGARRSPTQPARTMFEQLRGFERLRKGLNALSSGRSRRLLPRLVAPSYGLGSPRGLRKRGAGSFIENMQNIMWDNSYNSTFPGRIEVFRSYVARASDRTVLQKAEAEALKRLGAFENAAKDVGSPELARILDDPPSKLSRSASLPSLGERRSQNRSRPLEVSGELRPRRSLEVSGELRPRRSLEVSGEQRPRRSARSLEVSDDPRLEAPAGACAETRRPACGCRPGTGATASEVLAARAWTGRPPTSRADQAGGPPTSGSAGRRRGAASPTGPTPLRVASCSGSDTICGSDSLTVGLKNTLSLSAVDGQGTAAATVKDVKQATVT
ncbi:unnamed protein product [Prorocentrum cordatum]|uniref:Uncharacterized protein n=1 Tax=Prorocentrum cordatum TaxID=2364126 RepID=A0ABN9PB75_9DINO|nr:unnamed protein product [Polarella glacialis]